LRGVDTNDTNNRLARCGVVDLLPWNVVAGELEQHTAIIKPVPSHYGRSIGTGVDERRYTLVHSAPYCFPVLSSKPGIPHYFEVSAFPYADSLTALRNSDISMVWVTNRF
jgi:hypothetical protein